MAKSTRVFKVANLEVIFEKGLSTKHCFHYGPGFFLLNTEDRWCGSLVVSLVSLMFFSIITARFGSFVSYYYSFINLPSIIIKILFCNKTVKLGLKGCEVVSLHYITHFLIRYSKWSLWLNWLWHNQNILHAILSF